MARLFVVASVTAPVLVGGAAFVLLARALAGSWAWGIALFAAFVVAYLGVFALLVRWGRAHPEQAEGFMGAWGRAMAFGSGGWERRTRGGHERRH